MAAELEGVLGGGAAPLEADAGGREGRGRGSQDLIPKPTHFNSRHSALASRTSLVLGDVSYPWQSLTLPNGSNPLPPAESPGNLKNEPCGSVGKEFAEAILSCLS